VKGMALPTGNLVSSTTLSPVLLHMTASSIPFMKQLPHQHGWIQPCTGKPLGFMTGRPEARVSIHEGNAYGTFPQTPLVQESLMTHPT